MLVGFRNDDLDRLETDRAYNMGLSEAIVRAYRKCMQKIRAAVDERDLYAIRALRFRKLKGDLTGQRELNLNDQYRLRVKLVKGGLRKKIIILGITK